jgi:DNA-binding beta-propeller fold protein YncE
MKHLHQSMTAALAIGAVMAAWAAEQGLPWHAAATIEIPQSPGRFDILRVDPTRHRLLAAHAKDGTSDVIDLNTHSLIARVKVGNAVDTAVDADSRFYYVSVQEGQRVAVLDAATLKEVNSIKVPGPTDAIIYEPKSDRMYVTHDDGADVWVIDSKEGKVVASVAIPGAPEFMVYDPSTDRIYLNIKTKDLVAVIDPSSNKVIAEWPTAPAAQPHGLALDAAGHRIFSAGANGKLIAIDTASGTAVGSVDITPKVDQIAFDPASGLLYCAGTDKMSVVRTSGGKLARLGDLATAATARNVAVDPATRIVWTTYTDGKSSFAKGWTASQP